MKPFKRRPEPIKRIRVNMQIRVPEIRLIDAEGEQRGVMTPQEALQIAEKAELDLVEIAPTAKPPVCRVMDFSKYKYDQAKKEKEARKKQKVHIDGDETSWEHEPLERLAAEGQLSAFLHRGFWQPMDTMRDKTRLEELWESGQAPWKVW